MATYYFRNVNNAWGTATNWSLTSGGGATGAVPSTGDNAIFDNNSFSTCVLSTNRDCADLSFNNWTGTFDMSGVLMRIRGNLDFGSSLFSVINSGAWQMGSTTGTMNGQTIRTNGKEIGHFQLGYIAGTVPAILLDNLTAATFTNLASAGSPSVPLLTGCTFYNKGSVVTSSGNRNLYMATPMKLVGTGSLTTFNSTAALGCDIEIMTTGTITLNGNVFAQSGFKLKHTSGSVITAGSTLTINQAPSILECSAITFNNVICNNTITLNQTLYSNSIEFGSGGLCTLSGTSGFDVNNFNFILNGRVLALQTGNTYIVRNSMTCLAATLAAKNIIQSSTVNTKAIFNLSPGASQDNGYLSATDIDSSGGRSIWTYKGILTREINWNLHSTNPKKHVLKNKNRILK